MSDLLPCPFCGTPPATSEVREAGGYWFAHCLECDADGPTGYSRAEAHTAWNRRAPVAGEPVPQGEG